MLHDSFPDFEGEVEPGEARIAVLEGLDNAEGVEIVVEAPAHMAHLPVQLFLARVRERRVADVMTKSQSLCQVLIQTESGCHRARDLRHLDGVRQPVAEVIGNAGGKDLHLVFQPAKRSGVDNAITIALEFTAVRMRKLRVAPAAALGHRKTQAANCRRDQFFWDRSSSALRAPRLMLLRGLPRNGSSILRARAGSLGATNRARAMVAASLETSSVG